MSNKPKCSKCNERDVFSKGLCSGCYGRKWREERKIERAAAIAPKQLTSGVTADEMEAVEAEVVGVPVLPETHLVATDPLEMKAAQGDLKAWLEGRLSTLERDIIEANAALNEARKNGWTTASFVSARNRAVDDETFYHKVLMAVEAGHTIIPDFPISVFAVRRFAADQKDKHTWTGRIERSDTWMSNPAETDSAPAGAGEYRNPQPQVLSWFGFETTDREGKKYKPYTIERTGKPVGPIAFPGIAAVSPLMKATAAAMSEKVFDQIGVCHPVVEDRAARRIQASRGRAGDPLIIGQVVRKALGGKRKVVSFLIGWHLNLNEL